MSGLPAQADETDGRLVLVAGQVGRAPLVARFGLHLDRAGELVDELSPNRVALVLARRADVIIDAVAQPHRADEPAAERMVHLQAGIVGEDAGNAGSRRLLR